MYRVRIPDTFPNIILWAILLHCLKAFINMSYYLLNQSFIPCVQKFSLLWYVDFIHKIWTFQVKVQLFLSPVYFRINATNLGCLIIKIYSMLLYKSRWESVIHLEIRRLTVQYILDNPYNRSSCLLDYPYRHWDKNDLG